MIPKLTVSVLILVVAIVAFAGLAYQTVPMSTTVTVTQESTEARVSYSPYFVADTIIYTTSTSTTSTVLQPATTYCEGGFYPAICVGYPPGTATLMAIYTGALHSTYTVQTLVTISYSQTMTGSITESSTNIVPAYSSLGLTDTAFGALSILVIGILALVTGWFALKSKTSRPRRKAQPKKEEKVDSKTERVTKNFCTECGKELEIGSKFCNNCGAKQH